MRIDTYYAINKGKFQRYDTLRVVGVDMANDVSSRLERMSGMLKRRGFILPAFEIHGGAKGLYDFGPNGGRLRTRVNQLWLEHWTSLGNIVEISSPTITPYEVLEASGHVGEFSDFMLTTKTFVLFQNQGSGALSCIGKASYRVYLRALKFSARELPWRPVSGRNRFFRFRRFLNTIRLYSVPRQ
mgnify:CR=1 FL=1